MTSEPMRYQGIKGIMMDDSHKVEDKAGRRDRPALGGREVKLIFMKHGIPPVNKATHLRFFT